MGNREACKRWRDSNRERMSQSNAAYRARNPEKIRDINLRRAGWTLHEFNEQLAVQNYRCAICETDLLLLPTKFVHADHSHSTGERRGILCNWCNIGLGAFRDDQKRLTAAVTYLKRRRK